jgi:hypothetical protein
MTKKLKKLLLESGSKLSPKQIDLIFDIVSLENKIIGMKLMQTGKKGYSSHQADTLIFNQQIELDELLNEMGSETFKW